MSEETTTFVDEMDYAGLMQNALRGVIREALKRAATPEGLPGKHHFYVSFLTQARGVSMPKDVLAKYPHDITIVFNRDQFRDLEVREDDFDVVLSFGGQPRSLTVPFHAVTRFFDPEVKFVLEFEFVDDPEAAETETPFSDADKTVSHSQTPTEPAPLESKIVSLDQVRKK